MAHPKHKISSTRRDKRRTHYKAVVPTVVTCSNCGAAVLYHRVCPECGFYRGKLAIEKTAADYFRPPSGRAAGSRRALLYRRPLQTKD